MRRTLPILALAALAGCGGSGSKDTAAACVPGVAYPCTCPGGALSGRVCEQSGAGFGECMCGGATSAVPVAGSAPALDVTTTGTDAPPAGGAAPTVGSVTLGPPGASKAMALACEAHDAVDPDGDAVSLAYAWTVAGIVVAGETGATLAPAAFKRGDAVTCTVTPSDGAHAGVPVTSPPLTIANALPTAPGVALSPPAPVQGDALTCQISAPSVDADDDAVTYAYSWVQNGSSSSWAEPSLPGNQSGTGDTWACRVTPSDGLSSGPYGEASVTIGSTGGGPPPDGCGKLPGYGGHEYLSCCCKPWQEAAAACAAWGGGLVRVDDADEAAYLAQYVSTPGESFVGMSDVAAEDAYVWSTGGPGGFATWCPGEPSHTGVDTGGCTAPTIEEDCVALTAAKCLEDFPCFCAWMYFCER